MNIVDIFIRLRFFFVLAKILPHTHASACPQQNVLCILRAMHTIREQSNLAFNYFACTCHNASFNLQASARVAPLYACCEGN